MELIYEINNPSDQILTQLKQYNSIQSSYGLNNDMHLNLVNLFDEDELYYDIGTVELLVSDILMICIKNNYTSLNDAVEYLAKQSNKGKDYYIRKLGKWFYDYWYLTEKNKRAVYQDIIENTTLEFGASELYYNMSQASWSYTVHPYYTPPQKEWLKIKEAAEYLDVGYEFIRQGINNGTLIAAKKQNGKMIRINIHNLKAWADRGFGPPINDDNQEDKYTTKKAVYKPYEAAFEMNCSETTIRNEIKKGNIIAHIKDGIIVIYSDDLLNWQLSKAS